MFSLLNCCNRSKQSRHGPVPKLLFLYNIVKIIIIIKRYSNHYFCFLDKSVLHEENPLGLSNGVEGSVKDSSEDVFHSDLLGKVKENILPDYTSYMTSLVFSAHGSPVQSPCQSSTQGSPTDKEQVSFKQTCFVS